jgi:hypothetical protein
MNMIQAKCEVFDFISYIGSVLGLWLGFTFVGMIDYANTVIRAHASSVMSHA